MKKIIFIFTIFLIGSITFAENAQESSQTKETNKNTITENSEISDNNSEYTTVTKGTQTFYYDKQGKLIAHDKTLKGETFFYNKVGQFVGKSVERNDKTYYYNALNNFLGVCEREECFDKDFVSIGKIPPLPKINNFIPVIDNNIVNPQSQETQK